MSNVSCKIHTLIKIWCENGKIQYEEEDKNIYCEPELILDLPDGYRPRQDWCEESIGEIFYLDEYILPDNFEVYEEPILYECIGTFYITGHKDYYDEYDEDYDFELEQWSCEAIEEDIKEDIEKQNEKDFDYGRHNSIEWILEDR